MPKNNIASLGKSASVICVEEVFDDSYHQPSSDGELLQIHTLFYCLIRSHIIIDSDNPIAFLKYENGQEKMSVIIAKATLSMVAVYRHGLLQSGSVLLIGNHNQIICFVLVCRNVN